MVLIHLRQGKGVLAVVHFKFHNFFYGTLEDGTQYANGMSGHVLVIFQPVDLAGAEAIVLDQPVLTDVFFLHGFPQWIIDNHS